MRSVAVVFAVILAVAFAIPADLQRDLAKLESDLGTLQRLEHHENGDVNSSLEPGYGASTNEEEEDEDDAASAAPEENFDDDASLSPQTWETYPDGGSFLGKPLSGIVPKPTFIPRTGQAGATWMTNTLGSPSCVGGSDRECALTRPCSCRIGNSRLASKITLRTFNTGERTLSLRGWTPFVDAAIAALEEAKKTYPEVVRALKTEGGLCCRKIKKKDGTLGRGFSNHSWGTAIDFKFGAEAQRSIERGIAIIARFFVKKGFYWLWNNDGMHIEASQAQITQWSRTH